jgi:hypothetical protein
MLKCILKIKKLFIIEALNLFKYEQTHPWLVPLGIISIKFNERWT